MLMCIPGAATGVASVFLSFVLVAGCASSDQMVFAKAGVSPADRQKDENECLHASVSADDQSRILAPFQVDRDRFRTCMESKGYTAAAAK